MLDVYFHRICKATEIALDNHKEIAIFPYGQAGMFAYQVITQRYGRDVVCIDSKISKYNKEVISLDDFKKYDTEKFVVILCSINENVNDELQKIVRKEIGDICIVDILTELPEIHEEKEKFFKRIHELCKVFECSNNQLVRIGEQKDGGYIQINDFKEIEGVFSFGISTNSMWDVEMAEKGNAVYCFDPYVNGIVNQPKNCTFYRMGISGNSVDCISGKYMTLDEILRMTKLENSRNLLLKMDIEGMEWEVIQNLDTEILEHFKQMTFELHDVSNINNSEKILICLEKLTKYHVPIWIHANNAGRLEKAGKYIVPQLLEVTFVRKSDYEVVETPYICPMHLDAKNVDGTRDISLGNWNI